jgi:CHASE3 domain sensor protein
LIRFGQRLGFIMERSSYHFKHPALAESMLILNDVNRRGRSAITDDLLDFRDLRRRDAAKRILDSRDGEELESVAVLVSAATARMLEQTLHRVLDQQREMISAMAKAIDQAMPLAGEVIYGI